MVQYQPTDFDTSFAALSDAEPGTDESPSRSLPTFSAESSERARRTLSSRRVEVRLGVGVERVTPTRVHLTDGTVVDAHTLVRAAGVTASPLAAAVGTPTGRGAGPMRSSKPGPRTGRFPSA